MNIKNIKTNEDGKLQCPVCNEFELEEIKIFDTSSDESYDTGDLKCDNPDCDAEFSQTKGGELL